MPITKLKVQAVSKIIAADEEPEEDVSTEKSPEATRQAQIFQFISTFLSLNPQPSDEQVHVLSELVGITPEEFEAVVYKALGLLLDNHVDEETLSDLADDLENSLENDVLEDPSEEADEEVVTDESSDEDLLEDGSESNPESSDEELDDEEDPSEEDVEAAFGERPNVKASDPYGRAAEFDGNVDEEVLDGSDTLKDASEFDGAPDEEMLLDPTIVTP